WAPASDQASVPVLLPAPAEPSVLPPPQRVSLLGQAWVAFWYQRPDRQNSRRWEQSAVWLSAREPTFPSSGRFYHPAGSASAIQSVRYRPGTIPNPARRKPSARKTKPLPARLQRHARQQKMSGQPS